MGGGGGGEREGMGPSSCASWFPNELVGWNALTFDPPYPVGWGAITAGEGTGAGAGVKGAGEEGREG